MKLDNIQKEIYLAIQDIFLEQLIDKTPMDSGYTGASWDIKFDKNSIIIFNTNGDIIRYLEEGTGIYGPKKQEIIIKPKNKKSLRWRVGGLGSAGHDVFAKKVVIKGIKPLYFIDKILSNRKNWEDLAERIGQKVILPDVKVSLGKKL